MLRLRKPAGWTIISLAASTLSIAGIDAAYAEVACSAGSTAGGVFGSADCSAKVSGYAGTEAGAPAAGQSSVPVVDPCSYAVFTGDVGWVAANRTVSEVNATTMSSGTWLERACPDAGGSSVLWSPPPGEAAPPSPAVLAQEAVTTVTLPAPSVSLDPFYLLEDGRRATLKNAQTWVWVDPAQWVTLTPRVDVGPVWVQATIVPQAIVIEVNDGVTEPMSCAGPGTAPPAGTPMNEPSPSCSVQFTQPTDGETWPVTVRVSYSASWAGFDGTSMVSGSMPDLMSAPTVVPLAVLTAKPELIDATVD